MKKTFTILLALLLALSVTACANSKNENSTVEEEKTDISSYLKDGIIPNAEFALGTPISALEEKYNTLAGKEHSEYAGEDEEEIFDKIEGYSSYHYIFNDCFYYYRKAKEELGVGYIITFSDTLGFSIGETTMTDVKSTVSTELKEKIADENKDLFFFDYVSFEEVRILYAETDSKVLNFIFSDNVLIAVSIYDTVIWDE